MPQRPHPHRVEFAFRRALRWLGVASLLAAATRDDVLARLEKGWRRVRMKRGGGFVPNEATSPARSLNPVHVRSLGRRRHRTASHFPAEVDKRRHARSEVFSSPSRGVTPHFSSNRTAVRGRRGERAVSMQGRVSGPGS